MSDRPNNIDKIHTVIVPVSDQDRAIEFYTQQLGLEKRSDTPFGGGGRWVEVAPAGAETTIAIVPPPPDKEAGGAMTGISLKTSDIETDHARLKSHGVDVDEEIMRMGDPVPPMFWLRDPDANVLMVVETD